MTVIFSPKSSQDLREIALYIAKDNVRRAISFSNDIERHCENIASMPEGFPRRNDLSDGLRMATHKDYLIFYRLSDNDIRIERILHGARDYTTLF